MTNPLRQTVQPHTVEFPRFGPGANRLRTVSYGEERPKYDNAREEPRRLNRRAAMVVRSQR